jgi:hypothetical protein
MKKSRPPRLDRLAEVTAVLAARAAGDDVHRGPPAGELVEGRERPGGQRRGHEPGAVGHQEAEPLGVGGGVRGDLGAVRLGGVVADEHPVEARVLVSLGEYTITWP